MDKKGYPGQNWFVPETQRVSPLDERKCTLFHRFLFWKIRKDVNSDVNLNVFRVLVRLGNIFFKYILFMVWVMRKGKIDRVKKELIILRVAWRLGCVYE